MFFFFVLNLPVDVNVNTVGPALWRSSHVRCSIETVVLPSVKVLVTVIVYKIYNKNWFKPIKIKNAAAKSTTIL